MDGTMSTHTYRTLDVPVDGGDLRVAVWDHEQERTDDVLLIHGVTSSHLAWPFVVDGLPGIRAVAPDLRGRGASNALRGPAGMRAHADDLAATLDALGIDKMLVVGHSMGAFVAVVFAHRHPDRVSRLLLVDGGLPLDVPTGLDADEMISRVLGPTGARLSMRFADVGEYLAFWRDHPAFRADWSPQLEEYLAYDLVPDGATLRPATSYAVTAEDTTDMNSGDTLAGALAALDHPTRLVTVPRGLRDEEPGLYAPAHLEEVLRAHPAVRHERLGDFNHYTIVLSRDGGAEVSERIMRELAADRAAV
jgi:lipase